MAEGGAAGCQVRVAEGGAAGCQVRGGWAGAAGCRCCLPPSLPPHTHQPPSSKHCASPAVPTLNLLPPRSGGHPSLIEPLLQAGSTGLEELRGRLSKEQQRAMQRAGYASASAYATGGMTPLALAAMANQPACIKASKPREFALPHRTALLQRSAGGAGTRRGLRRTGLPSCNAMLRGEASCRCAGL